eukprot:gene22719-biopygen11768
MVPGRAAGRRGGGRGATRAGGGAREAPASRRPEGDLIAGTMRGVVWGGGGGCLPPPWEVRHSQQEMHRGQRKQRAAGRTCACGGVPAGPSSLRDTLRCRWAGTERWRRAWWAGRARGLEFQPGALSNTHVLWQRLPEGTREVQVNIQSNKQSKTPAGHLNPEHVFGVELAELEHASVLRVGVWRFEKNTDTHAQQVFRFACCFVYIDRDFLDTCPSFQHFGVGTTVPFVVQRFDDYEVQDKKREAPPSGTEPCLWNRGPRRLSCRG